MLSSSRHSTEMRNNLSVPVGSLKHERAMTNKQGGEIHFDPNKQEVRGDNFSIVAAGDTVEDGHFLHLYLYEDPSSRFYFAVERFKRPTPAFTVVDSRVCDVQYLGYERRSDPKRHLLIHQISAEQRRVAIPNIVAGMTIMELPNFGRPVEVKISKFILG